jgi:hypothetical protein
VVHGTGQGLPPVARRDRHRDERVLGGHDGMLCRGGARRGLALPARDVRPGRRLPLDVAPRGGSDREWPGAAAPPRHVPGQHRRVGAGARREAVVDVHAVARVQERGEDLEPRREQTADATAACPLHRAQRARAVHEAEARGPGHGGQGVDLRPVEDVGVRPDHGGRAGGADGPGERVAHERRRRVRPGTVERLARRDRRHDVRRCGRQRLPPAIRRDRAMPGGRGRRCEDEDRDRHALGAGRRPEGHAQCSLRGEEVGAGAQGHRGRPRIIVAR